MPRQANRGGYGGRQSSSSDQYKAITDSAKSCESVLENISRILIESSAYFNQENMNEWSNNVMSLANANVQINHTVAYTKRNFDAMEPLPDESAKTIVKKMKDDITELSKTDTTHSEFVKKIGKILQIGGDDEEEEDLVMIEARDKERDFMCPFTAMKIEIPMKNRNCKHIISQKGLDASLNRRPFAPCPVAGCRAQWTKATASVDKDFEKRMQRFFRVQEETGGTEHMAHVATELLDDDEEEEEYTQI